MHLSNLTLFLLCTCCMLYIKCILYMLYYSTIIWLVCLIWQFGMHRITILSMGSKIVGRFQFEDRHVHTLPPHRPPKNSRKKGETNASDQTTGDDPPSPKRPKPDVLPQTPFVWKSPHKHENTTSTPGDTTSDSTSGSSTPTPVKTPN